MATLGLTAGSAPNQITVRQYLLGERMLARPDVGGIDRALAARVSTGLKRRDLASRPRADRPTSPDRVFTRSEQSDRSDGDLGRPQSSVRIWPPNVVATQELLEATPCSS
jgi:hypothetical protein